MILSCHLTFLISCKCNKYSKRESARHSVRMCVHVCVHVCECMCAFGVTALTYKKPVLQLPWVDAIRVEY